MFVSELTAYKVAIIFTIRLIIISTFDGGSAMCINKLPLVWLVITISLKEVDSFFGLEVKRKMTPCENETLEYMTSPTCKPLYNGIESMNFGTESHRVLVNSWLFKNHTCMSIDTDESTTIMRARMLLLTGTKLGGHKRCLFHHKISVTTHEEKLPNKIVRIKKHRVYQYHIPKNTRQVIHYFISYLIINSAILSYTWGHFTKIYIKYLEKN